MDCGCEVAGFLYFYAKKEMDMNKVRVVLSVVVLLSVANVSGAEGAEEIAINEILGLTGKISKKNL